MLQKLAVDINEAEPSVVVPTGLYNVDVFAEAELRGELLGGFSEWLATAPPSLRAIDSS